MYQPIALQKLTSRDAILLEIGQLFKKKLCILYIYGCGRVVKGAGRKVKRMVLQCINGVGSNPVEGRTKM